VELAVATALIGICAAVAVPRIATVTSRLSVQSASQDVILALAAARSAATRRGDYASFVADPGTGRIRVISGGETLLERNITAGHGVKLEVTRDSITYAPTGLGYGAANTTIVLSRGDRADTIVTSRMGRVRH
jgi:Tfp pilus assembly protein FimT